MNTQQSGYFLAPTLVSAAPKFEAERASFQDAVLGATPTYVKQLVAGGVAGGLSKTAVAPLERIKILYQVDVPSLIQKLTSISPNTTIRRTSLTSALSCHHVSGDSHFVLFFLFTIKGFWHGCKFLTELWALQIKHGNFQSMGVFRSLSCITRTEGFRGLYK